MPKLSEMSLREIMRQLPNSTYRTRIFLDEYGEEKLKMAGLETDSFYKQLDLYMLFEFFYGGHPDATVTLQVIEESWFQHDEVMKFSFRLGGYVKRHVNGFQEFKRIFSNVDSSCEFAFCLWREQYFLPKDVNLALQIFDPPPLEQSSVYNDCFDN